MKSNLLMIFSFIIIFFCGWWIFDYMSRDGEFVKWSHAAAGIEQFADGKVIYLGYSFMWDGIGKPEIQKLEFFKKDGTIVGEEDDELHLQPFIATMNTIGVLDEEYVLNEELNNDFANVNGYQVNGDFHLVLRVKGDGIREDNDIETVSITYKKYGITQIQNLPFDEGIIMDNN